MRASTFNFNPANDTKPCCSECEHSNTGLTTPEITSFGDAGYSGSTYSPVDAAPAIGSILGTVTALQAPRYTPPVIQPVTYPAPTPFASGFGGISPLMLILLLGALVFATSRK